LRNARRTAAPLIAACLALSLWTAGAAAKQLPDLRLTDISNPTKNAHPGDQLKVKDSIKNAGTKSAKPSKARFYLSADRKQGSGDVRLAGSQSIGKLQPGVKASANGSFGIPNSTPDGKYFLIGCADDTNVVHESNEKDNCLSSARKVKVAPKPPESTTPYAVNAGDFPIGTSVELDGLEVTAVGSRRLFWVEVPSGSPDFDLTAPFNGYGNSALEAKGFSGAPSLVVGDRVDVVGKVEAGGFELPELGATSVDVTDTNQLNNVPVALGDGDLLSPPAALDGVLAEVGDAKKDSESPDGHQWTMENPQTHPFGVDDLVIGTLPTGVSLGSVYGTVIGVADTDSDQNLVVLSPRSNGDFQN
jgi:CARDB